MAIKFKAVYNVMQRDGWQIQSIAATEVHWLVSLSCNKNFLSFLKTTRFIWPPICMKRACYHLSGLHLFCSEWTEFKFVGSLLQHTRQGRSYCGRILLLDKTSFMFQIEENNLYLSFRRIQMVVMSIFTASRERVHSGHEISSSDWHSEQGFILLHQG